MYVEDDRSTGNREQELLEALKKDIEKIDPESWSKNGGQGTIRSLSPAKFAIYQTPQVHAKINDYLAELAAEMSLKGKLKTGIDLSAIKMGVPLSEAIAHVQNSFDPPLPIVVDWEDLRTNAGVLPMDKARPDSYTRAPAGEALLKILFYARRKSRWLILSRTAI